MKNRLKILMVFCLSFFVGGCATIDKFFAENSAITQTGLQVLDLVMRSVALKNPEYGQIIYGFNAALQGYEAERGSVQTALELRDFIVAYFDSMLSEQESDNVIADVKSEIATAANYPASGFSGSDLVLIKEAGELL